jgi:dTDP-4-dehydrorhamnose reductase
MRLLVTGASGLLGIHLCLVAAAQGHQVSGLTHTQVLQGVPFTQVRANLLDMDEALAVIEKTNPDAIVHCAAVADLNVAEKQPELAFKLNRDAAGDLAAACARWGIPLVHISTDAVFDGATGGYDELSLPNPLSVYAKTKLAGEQAVQENHPDAIIGRVVFYGWSIMGARSLAEFFFNNLNQGKRIKGFTDTYFCPLYVEDLAEILMQMLTARLGGLYHVVSPENLSKYDFGIRIAQRFGFDASLVDPIRMQDLARGAPRALNLVLKSDKLQQALGRPLPAVDDGLERLYQRWRDKYPQQLHAFAVH